MLDIGYWIIHRRTLIPCSPGVLPIGRLRTVEIMSADPGADLIAGYWILVTYWLFRMDCNLTFNSFRRPCFVKKNEAPIFFVTSISSGFLLVV